jgi:hypothetical protein
MLAPQLILEPIEAVAGKHETTIPGVIRWPVMLPEPWRTPLLTMLPEFVIAPALLMVPALSITLSLVMVPPAELVIVPPWLLSIVPLSDTVPELITLPP